jgi:hypothetical protein
MNEPCKDIFLPHLQLAPTLPIIKSIGITGFATAAILQAWYDAVGERGLPRPLMRALHAAFHLQHV